jgi:hypothetical protein
MRALKLSALVVFLAPAAWAQDVVTVEASGEAAIVKGDEARALDEATKAALRTAVEQVAGVSIEGQTQTLNNVLVRDQVIARTSGYVKKHEVVSKKSEKGVLSVKVKAEVGKSEISKDVEAARALVKRFGRPSLVIMIQEQTAQVDASGKATGVVNSDVTATVLTNAFKGDGWDIKDPAFAMGKVRIAPGVQLGAGEAKEIGDLTKANYILYGTTSMRQAVLEGNMGAASTGKGQNAFPVTGEYDLALFSTDSGTQLAKLSGALNMNPPADNPKQKINMSLSYERTAHEVINARAKTIAQPVRQAALEYFRNREMNGAEVIVAVGGLTNYAGAQEFKKALEALPGVKEVEQQDFKSGTGNYRVTFTGSTSDFADAIGKATFKKKKLEVSEVTGSKVVVAVAK